MQDTKVVTRFAPSPTGFMHVGGARTALYAWLLAKKHKGAFILRIEDTDKEREVEGSIEHIKKSLKWLSLDWDEGPDIGGSHAPYIQSERLELYKKYANILIEKGLAYADPYTEEEIENFRKISEEQKKPFLYREHRPKNPPIWDGSKPLRFKITEPKRTEWRDLVWGDLSAGPEALDDFIIIKSDGYPTYNFAHIIDDIEMGVTHIVRGQEFIASTPKFLAVYKALEIAPPYFVTTPPIMGADGKRKLGKRDGAKDILDYDIEGYLPEAMINFLAFLGFNPGGEREIYTKEELAEVFDLNKIQKSGAMWNDDKLDWMNKEHMRLLPVEERNEKIRSKMLSNPEISKFETAHDQNLLDKICPTIFDRISKWSDIDTLISDGELTYYFTAPSLDPEKIMWKKQTQEDAKKNLEKVLEILKLEKDQTLKDPQRSDLWGLAEKEGKGEVLWPTRYTLSGKEKSPDPFTLINILGIQESKERIENAIKLLS